MTDPVPSDIDGPTGEAGDLIERARVEADSIDGRISSSEVPAMSRDDEAAMLFIRDLLREAASALAACQADLSDALRRATENLERVVTAEAKVAALAAELEKVKRERNEALEKTYKKAVEEITLDIETGYVASVREVEALTDALSASERKREKMTTALTLARPYVAAGLHDGSPYDLEAIDAALQAEESGQ